MKLLKKIFDCEIKAIDVGERTLTAYVSTGGRDRMNEVLIPEGVDLKMFKKNPVVLFAHDYRRPPIAKALWVKRDEGGIISKMKFANTEFADEIFNLYKDGFMKAFSVGFISREHKYGKGTEPSITYLKWELLEYSAVPVPANPEALALAISKGVLKDKDLKALLNDTTAAAGADTKTVKVKTKEPEKKEKTNPELLTELKMTQGENIALKLKNTELANEVLDLKFELLKKNDNKERTLSEITDGEILKKIEDVAVGVIRKITGKVS